ncbi:MAG: hypothetical protein RLP14_09190 [Owenweeksia sp.]
MSEKKTVDRKGVYYVLLIVLLGLIITTFFLYRYQEDNKNLEVHKRVLMERLADALTEYKSLKTENDSLSRLIEADQNQILSLMDSISYVSVRDRDKLVSFEETFERVRKELIGLRFKVDSLTLVNDSLINENRAMNVRASQLESSNKELEGAIASNAGLKINSFRVDAINEKRGTENITSSNFWTDYLKVCFTVVENTLAEKGSRPVYIRVINPDRTIMTNNDKTQFIELENARLFYTIKQTVDYQGSILNECYQVKREDFDEGTYLVELYLDGKKQASAQLILD